MLMSLINANTYYDIINSRWAKSCTLYASHLTYSRSWRSALLSSHICTEAQTHSVTGPTSHSQQWWGCGWNGTSPPPHPSASPATHSYFCVVFSSAPPWGWVSGVLVYSVHRNADSSTWVEWLSQYWCVLQVRVELGLFSSVSFLPEYHS